jgi:hypothetical protein
VRRQAEEVRKRELAAAQGLRDRALMLLAASENDLKGMLLLHSRARAEKVDLGREAWFLARNTGLQREISGFRTDLLAKEEALAAARGRAVEASRERLALENLEARQLQEHQALVNKEEQGLLDELAQRSVSAFRFPDSSLSGPGLEPEPQSN